jgi:ABC-type cobalamin/Fe3+-siderophores transport system ATPase subunit
MIDEKPRAPDPLADLDLHTAIRLRWVLRDVRKGRTRFMVPHDDDLALLEQRGLITVEGGEPVLTSAGDSVI